jgi:hypothetical protein
MTDNPETWLQLYKEKLIELDAVKDQLVSVIVKFLNKIGQSQPYLSMHVSKN